jgi:hypothetical protein
MKSSPSDSWMCPRPLSRGAKQNRGRTHWTWSNYCSPGPTSWSCVKRTARRYGASKANCLPLAQRWVCIVIPENSKCLEMLPKGDDGPGGISSSWKGGLHIVMTVHAPV